MGVVTPGMPRKKPRPAEFTEVDFSLLFRAMCDDLQEPSGLEYVQDCADGLAGGDHSLRIKSNVEYLEPKPEALEFYKEQNEKTVMSKYLSIDPAFAEAMKNGFDAHPVRDHFDQGTYACPFEVPAEKCVAFLVEVQQRMQASSNGTGQLRVTKSTCVDGGWTGGYAGVNAGPRDRQQQQSWSVFPMNPKQCLAMKTACAPFKDLMSSIEDKLMGFGYVTGLKTPTTPAVPISLFRA